MLHDLRVTVCVCSEGSALFHIRDVYMYFVSFLMRENDVIPSNVMEMKTDVNKKSKWRPNGAN